MTYNRTREVLWFERAVEQGRVQALNAEAEKLRDRLQKIHREVHGRQERAYELRRAAEALAVLDVEG